MAGTNRFYIWQHSVVHFKTIERNYATVVIQRTWTNASSIVGRGNGNRMVTGQLFTSRNSFVCV